MEITPELQAVIDEQLSTQKAELTTKFEQDSAGLLKAKNDLLSEKKAAQEEARVVNEEAERVRLEKAAKDRDVVTLSESYEQKLKAIKDENSKLMSGIKQAEINKISNAFVSENCVDDPFIREAMNSAYSKRVDIREGKPAILDPDGNLTALSIADLNSEFKTASKYSAHIRATKSTGGGASGNRNTGGAGAMANIHGTTAEKSAALVNAIPELANLPVR